jgi:hypothetical protein
MPYTPMMTYHNAPYHPVGRPQQHPPNAKSYNNLKYCWTHGADIADAHLVGHTCQCPPAHYHQLQATRYNTMGGSQQGLYKMYGCPVTCQEGRH